MVLCHAWTVSSEYVSTGEAARAVGVPHSSLVRWAKAGLVTYKRRTPGGHYQWDVEQLRRELDAMPVNARAGTEAGDTPGA